MANEYNVYAGQDGVMDYVTPVAQMDLADTSVSMVIDLPAGTIWEFVRRRKADDCALESADSPACEVRIDGSGDMIPDAPNAPTNLVAVAEAAGIVRLRWRYCEVRQAVAPTAFRIYIDSGSGFNFALPSQSKTFVAGGGEFTDTISGLSAGTQHRFCVRAYNATTTGESQNTNFVTATPVSSGPAGLPTPLYEVTEE
jgi:hypothetical protein